jgi:hypothetical protein
LAPVLSPSLSNPPRQQRDMMAGGAVDPSGIAFPEVLDPRQVRRHRPGWLGTVNAVRDRCELRPLAGDLDDNMLREMSVAPYMGS